MQFSVLPNWAAPLSTGHSFGLPETGVQVKSVTRVAAVSKQSFSDTGMMQEKSPPPFSRPATGQRGASTNVAPPSIMQLKISELLNTQAQNLAGQAAEADPEVDSEPEAPELVSRDPEETEKPKERAPNQHQAIVKSGYAQVSGLSGEESPALENTVF